MKKILILFGLIILLFVASGCIDKRHNNLNAYFDMGMCCEKEDWQQKCNDLCFDSGLRLDMDQGKTEVILKDCQYICRCY